MKNRALAVVALIVVLAASAWALLTFLPNGTPQATGLTRVTVRLKWVHQAQFAGFYVAKEKGYYKDVGIDADLEPGGSNFPAIQTVVSGGEAFGVTGADQVLIARSKGADVVPVLVVFQRSPFVLFARRDGPVKAIQDIVGKNVGVKLGGNEELTYRAMLVAARIRANSVTEIPVNIDMSLFFSGRVDVWPGYSINEPLIAEEQGIPVREFTPDQLGLKLYADTVFTTSARVKGDPGLVLRFIGATKKGWEYAIEHPAEAAQITMKYASGTTLAHQTAMMNASLPDLAPSGSTFGDMSTEGWKDLEALLLAQKFIDKQADVAGMLSESERAGATVK